MRLITILFFFTQVMFAQDKFVLSGKVKSSMADAVYLYYPCNGTYEVDSLLIEDNQFKFEGSVDYPVLATLELKDKQRTSVSVVNFYLENSPIQVDFQSNNYELKNSRTEDLKIEFIKSLTSIQEKFDSIQLLYQTKSQAGLINQEFQDSIDSEMKKIDEMNAEAIFVFVQKHPSDYFSLYLLESFVDNVQNYKQASILYEGLSQELQSSIFGKQVEQKLSRLKNIEIGSEAPDFELTDLNGVKFKLSDYKGKYLLLLFWSSDCRHCLDELTHIQNLYKEFEGNNFEIIAVAQNNLQHKSEWQDFVKNKNLKWVNAFDDRVEGKKKVARLYNVTKIPTDFVLNRKGQIILKDIYGDDLMNRLSLLLNMDKQ